MFESASVPHDSASPASEEGADPSVARAERRLRMLEELAEIGMALARSLKPGEEGPARDPAEAFARLSRAIRLTLALEARTDQDLRDLQAGVARAREEARTQAPERARKAREERELRAQCLVIEVAQAECETMEDFENLMEALDERVAQDDAYFEIGERPVREIVELLCKDLKLNPDWSRWDGEGWSLKGPPIRPKFSDFWTPSARPILKKAAPRLNETPPGRPSSSPAGYALE